MKKNFCSTNYFKILNGNLKKKIKYIKIITWLIIKIRIKKKFTLVMNILKTIILIKEDKKFFKLTIKYLLMENNSNLMKSIC